MPIYLKADDATVKLLDEVMAKHHKPLIDAELRVAVVVAIAKTDEAGNAIGTALKHHGVPALGLIRIVKHKDRVQGMADAEISIDGDRWAFLSREERIAVIDHELTHIVLIEDKSSLEELSDGSVKFGVARDDGGRPKLKMRHHDYEFGWFTEVAQRHGKNSQEMQQAATLVDEQGQVYFAFLGETKKAAKAA